MFAFFSYYNGFKLFSDYMNCLSPWSGNTLFVPAHVNNKNNNNSGLIIIIIIIKREKYAGSSARMRGRRGRTRMCACETKLGAQRKGAIMSDTEMGARCCLPLGVSLSGGTKYTHTHTHTRKECPLEFVFNISRAASSLLFIYPVKRPIMLRINFLSSPEDLPTLFTAF